VNTSTTHSTPQQERTGRRTLILGNGNFAFALAREIAARPGCGYELLGIVSSGPGDGLCGDLPILGTADELHRLILKTNAECIIVTTLASSGGHLPEYQLIEARVGRDLLIEDGEEIFEKLTGKLRIEALEPRGVIFDKTLKPSRFSQAIARIFSFVGALIGLVLTIPFLIIVGILVKLDSEGPMLFIQERVGLGGKPFKLLKFRTMRAATTRHSEWAGDNAHRITRVGSVLRKYRLDELPQFINVLRGDMNLVGPRPHPASNLGLLVLVSRNTPECGFQIPYYSLRSTVRPGITGWAQVRYRYANNLNEEIEKLRFDLYYVKHYSLWLDLQIIWETIAVVVGGKEFADKAPEEKNHEEPVAANAETAHPLAAASGDGVTRFPPPVRKTTR
jgi:exopolysaccharide biosynthesis polyprenyl glycosylphosphotransferase